MADQVEGGRERIGGLTLSNEEKLLIDRARRTRKRSRAEFLREAALLMAVEWEEQGGFRLLTPEEGAANPKLWDIYLSARGGLQQLRERARRPTGTK